MCVFRCTNSLSGHGCDSSALSWFPVESGGVQLLYLLCLQGVLPEVRSFQFVVPLLVDVHSHRGIIPAQGKWDL